MPRGPTFTDVVREHAQRAPAGVAFTFLTDGERTEVTRTYAEVDRRARAIAAELLNRGLRGERALLIFPPSLEYIEAFLGCLYAGVVAVPVYPPDPARLGRTLPRLQAVVTNARAVVALTTQPILAMSEFVFAAAPELSKLTWLATDVLEGDPDAWRAPSLGASTLAFLQYTSGSTGSPKGVMLTHENILHNERLIQLGFGTDASARVVGWLPLYHDMGLIGTVLHPLYLGATCVLMSPLAFLQQPMRWLSAISRYRATTSGAPNFAYELCVRKISLEQRATLDLSSWRTAFSGAEPVRAETLGRFAAAFAGTGFRREAFYPCYGLAEATLIVSGGVPGTGALERAVDRGALEQGRAVDLDPSDPEARVLVGCGGALGDETITVVHPESGAPCADGEVGEILCASGSVAAGYWDKPELSARVFRARVDGGSLSFLRTGDLGFRREGQLFVTGRMKDLIILNGRNHYPQDLERTVESCHAAMRPGCSAAFSVDTDAAERLVVVQEIDPRRAASHEDVFAAVRTALAEEHELVPSEIVLLAPGTIPKTSSGKIQRSACRDELVSGALPFVARWSPAAAVTSEDVDAAGSGDPLVDLVAAHLRIAPRELDCEKPITRYGLDSLTAIELQNEIERRFSISLPMATLLSGPSLDELAEAIARAELVVPIGGTAAAGDQPLSHGQDSLWFLQQLSPASGAYNLAHAVRLGTGTDLEALRTALEHVIARHDVLRTSFHQTPTGPVARVHPRVELDLSIRDVELSDAALDEELASAGARAFALEQAPLLRTHVYRRRGERPVLLLAMHHLISDFWSFALLLEELGREYAALRGGMPLALPPPSIRYADYVRWQAARIDGAEGERQARFWTRELAGTPPVLELPTDRPRPRVLGDRGGAVAFELTAALTTRLHALAEAEGTTLHAVLLSAFGVLLKRHAAQDEIWIGNPVATRDRAELADLLGYFVNPVVIRVDMAGNPTFVQLLARVRGKTLAALSHHEYPFGRLVDRLGVRRDAGRSPLFQAMFSLQRAYRLHSDGFSQFALGRAGAKLTIGGLELESMHLEQRTAQFDLQLMMAEHDGRLAAALHYQRDLFDERTVTAMGARFCALLDAITESPRRRVDELPLLPPEETRRLVQEWNATAHPVPVRTLVDAVAKRAAVVGSATALIHGEEALSYAALEHRANQVARHLRALGVSRGELVGVFIHRSIDMVVAMLGVMKAGAAYLPVDPAYPPDRVAYMLADSRAHVVLTEARLAGVVPDGVVAVRLDADATAIAEQPGTPLALATGADDLAYVIYTSGSTGRPKGVAVTHGGLANFCGAMDEVLGTEPGAWLALTSICFDISVLELLWTLTRGHRVVIHPEGHDPDSIARLLGEHAITHLQCTPSTARLLASHAGARDAIRRIDQLLIGGEALTANLLQELARSGPVLNMYGPTETTIWSATRVATADRSVVPIGVPIANTQLYVLDPWSSPAPTGAAGELWIGGAGVARGYLGRPDLTADRFRPDPFGVAGARLYRTGDLARWLPSGEMEFLGRIDHQVKVRGFRIELGEIEAALAELDTVKAVVVIARTDGAADSQLVAYLVAHGPVQPPIADLRRALSAKLPEYMLPSAFVWLDALPLTPNGKVDRQRLPAPDLSSPSSSVVLLEPRSPVEQAIAAVWSEVLGRERVGAETDFFELGGDSILATQIVSRLRQLFSTELPLRALFESPTVRGLATLVETRLDAAVLPALEPVLRTDPMPLSFAQERLWFLEQLEPGRATYHIPAALRLTGALDVGALEHAVSALVARHEALRSGYLFTAERAGQRIHEPRAVPLPLTDLSKEDPTARATRLEAITRDVVETPLALERSPLRLALVRVGAQEHVLLAVLHHLAADGWSLGVLFAELGALYREAATGVPAGLPPLRVQYADYAVWQRRWLTGAVLDEQLAYWKQALAGAPALCTLPTDRPRPAVQSHRGDKVPLQLEAGLVARMRAFGRDEGATLFMSLLAGLQALLHRYSGTDDVVVGAPIANRRHHDTEALIGLFTNSLVLRTDLSGRPSFRELLRRVREVTLGAYAHQDTPLEKLVEVLTTRRSQSHAPLFQILLVLQNAPAHELTLPGLRLELEPLSTHTAKLDLTIMLDETADGLRGSIEFATDLYERATIERLGRHLVVFLDAALRAPSMPIGELPFLADHERDHLLAVGSGPSRVVDTERTLHALFAEQAAATPERPAVVFGDETLSFTELARRSDLLAASLQAAGTRRGDRVGLLVERSASSVTAILAIWKAGAAYVPLDPEQPAQRSARILALADAKLVLVDGSHARHEAIGARAVVRIDEAATGDVKLVSDGGAGGGDAAYVLFTSGSTGEPKGVVVQHRSVVNLATALRESVYARFAAPLRVSVNAPLAFDASVKQLVTLLFGCTLCPTPREAREDLRAMGRWLEETAVEVLDCTPAHLGLMLAEGVLDGPGRGTRLVLCGGEAIAPSLWAALRARSRPTVFNVYGPTECTVDTTACELATAGEQPNIGRPLANVHAYVLDQAGQLVPRGIGGELYVGGAGVARGYLGRADLTAERFVPDPFGAPGARMYRTGDGARVTGDGALEYHGRLDHQVKVRGFRIELAEVEAALGRLGGVRAAVAVAVEHDGGERMLVAYLVGEARSAAELRASLSSELPDYMLPAAYVWLEQLPVSPNGKVDRKSLPAPVLALDARYVAPRTDVEQKLTTLWARLLRVERVGIHDNFFELGGDSILSIQLVSRAAELGLKLRPRDVFGQQTIAELAAVCVAVDTARPAEERATGDVALTPIEHRFFAQQLASPHHHNQALLLSVTDLDVARLDAALAELVSHHDGLRLRYTRSDTGWRKSYGDSSWTGFRTLDLRHLDAAAARLSLEHEAALEQSRFNLGEGPLFRAVLFQLGDRDQRLLLVAHHLVVDGVSWRILLEDLAQAYRGEALPRRTSSLQRWSEALGRDAATLEHELPFWQAQRSDQRLPREGDGPNREGDAKVVRVTLEEADTQALLSKLPAAYRTQADEVLLAALCRAITAWTGTGRMAVAIESHGREELADHSLDVSRTVGWFTAIYPLVLDLRGAATLDDTLVAVKEQLRAVPRRGLGYGVLRWLSRSGAELADIAWPELSFNYLGQLTHAEGDAWATRAAEDLGPMRGPENRRSHLIDAIAHVSRGRLELELHYAPGVHQRATIETLAARTRDALLGLVALARLPGAGRYTPSDFPLAALSAGELETLVGKRRDIEDVYPLAPAQQGLLFHSLLAPDAGAYLIQLEGTLAPDMDADAFIHAWQTVLDRNPSLRSSFAWRGLRAPVQLVAQRATLPVARLDLRGISAHDRAERLREFLAEDRCAGFDLASAPLMRLTLIEQDGGARRFVWTHHHLLLDGWSLPLVFEDLLLALDEQRGRPTVPVRRRPYRHHIEWLQQQDRADAERAWRAMLTGFDQPTQIGLERQTGCTGYARRDLFLDAAASAGLRAMLRERQLTLSTVILGAWGVLLARFGGARDVVFGTSVSGRESGLAGIETMIGLFINTLPVRLQVDDDSTVSAWLDALQRRQVELRRYEYTPLADVQAVSEVARGRALFDSLVVVENYPVEEALAARGAEVSGIELTEQTNYPLTLAAVPGDALKLSLSYDASRFAADDVERILSALACLLLQMAAAPLRQLRELSILDADERRSLVASTRRSYDSRWSVQARFEAQAAKRPTAVAVVCEGKSLTYAELNERANQLGHALQRRGVGPEVQVGLCVDRSLEMVVGILAILKAGGAYVPLDPRYPAERLAYMVEDAALGVVVTTKEQAAALPTTKAPMLLLDEEREALGRLPTANLGIASAPANAAYVIYTSGSTGKPKGVVVTHENVARLMTGTEEWYGFDETDVWTLFHSYAFDFSVWELWGALCYGGKVVVVPYLVSRSTSEFYQLLVDEQVTVLNQTPSAFRQLVEVDGASAKRDALSLRYVIFGGEALELQSLSPWFERHGDAQPRLVNMYGITETTVHVTYRPIGIADIAKGSVIGRPIGDLDVYVLDDRMEPMPIGVAGEMYVGGEGLARGYLRRPDVTAERFVPSPYGAPGERLYRTGDLARRLANGDLEYLGRIDQQVKIRGFRIELGEIEAALLAEPGVRDTVVLAREDVPGHKRLVAYVVSEDVTADALRTALKARLPEHMVPSAFVLLDALPLTSNGKLDRKALPVPDLPLASAAHVAPRNPVEETLARIWQELLGVERVGVHDDFFELGGDSILSIQIVSRASSAGLRLTVKQLFAHPTVAALAAVAEQGERKHVEQGLVSGEVVLTPVQRWLFEQDLPEVFHFNQALLFGSTTRLEPALLALSLSALESHHDALRMRFARDERGWTQREDAASTLAVEVITVQPDEDVEARILAEAERAQRALDLAHGPLARALLFELGARGQRLLLVVHHLVIDGVSWRVLIEQLELAYMQAERGAALALPPKTTSFQAWAARLADYAASDTLLAELPFWRAQLSESARLPVDASARGTGVAPRVLGKLAAAETDALLRSVPQAYHTQINDALLTALVRTVGAWAGTDELAVELEGHGREELFSDLDLTRTVGWFTTLYPVRLTQRPELGETLKTVKEQLRAVPSGGLGFGVLKYLASPEVRSELASHTPQLLFNYLGQTDAVAAEGRFFLAKEPIGRSVSEKNPRPHLLAVNAAVAEGELVVSWDYDPAVHERATIEGLAQRYTGVLRELIAYCTAPGAGGYTPSDFPLARLDAPTLDRLVAAAPDLEDVYPLSPMQEGLLFHRLHDPSSLAYVEQLRCALEGPLDATAFRSAWLEVIARHPILRTSFAWENLRRPLQLVHASAAPEITVEDWRALPPVELPARLDAYALAERTRGFQLEHAPLVRLALFRSAEARHELVWTYHHLLLDGWCLSLVLGEVFTAYEAAAHGAHARLEPTRPYRDYIAWLERQPRDAARAFWQRELGHIEAPTPLPMSRATGLASSAAHLSVKLDLSHAEQGPLTALVRHRQLTLSTVVQGAWGLLLARYAGVSEVVFGATVSGRPAELAGVDKMVGLFINTLPVRVDLDDTLSIGAWLQRLLERQVEARQVEHAPLVAVQGWSGVPRGQPLFESLLVFENYPIDAALRARRGGLRPVDVAAAERTTFPLVLLVVPGDTLALSLSFDPAFFVPDDAARLLAQLAHLLRQIGAQPDATLSSLDLLEADERRQLLVDWNDTARSYPDERVHDLFVAQARATPDAVALVVGDARTSYRELDERSDALARLLVDLGVGPDVRVGLCTKRDALMIIAQLAVLKAGGAYVPLDPAYPAERLAFIMDDARPSVLLTERELLGLVPAPAHVLCLDEPWPAPRATAPRRGSAANLAYLIYTSGSTGRPKGVAITHRNASVFLRWVKDTFSPAQMRGVLAATSICFDLSIFEIFGTLSTGGTIVLADNALALPTLPARDEVTLVNTVPSAAAELLRVGGIPTSVRTINLAGEPLSDRLTQDLYASGLERVYDLYGPSEDTTYSTFTLRERGPGSVTTIGRPIANTQAYLLDTKLGLVPRGAQGELYLAGAGLARGYLGRPDLTAERFVPNPFSADGARMYRTGDLARHLPDGRIEYLGRIDHQVKIRGFRIELGEIEAALLAEPGVRDTVVLAREDVPGHKRLVAYVASEDVTADALRTALKARLPEHMVPSAFVLLDALPLTPNGKVDRKALPVPDMPLASAAHVAPRNPVEETLAQIWRELLGVERVGVHDDFFELGGHSLVAIRLASRIRAELGVALSLQLLFTARTPAAQAILVEQDAGALTRISRLGPDEPPSLSLFQERMWRSFRKDPQSAKHNLSIGGQLFGALDLVLFGKALEQIARRHRILRMKLAVGPEGEVLVGTLSAEKATELVVHDLRSIPPERRELEARNLLVATKRRPFDLLQGPVWRTAVVRLDDDRHVVVVAMHHIVSDGVSLALLVSELAELYRSGVEKEAAKLPPLELQYDDFAKWHREQFHGKAHAEHDTYWSERLRGGPAQLQLPADRPSAYTLQALASATYWIELEPRLIRDLRALARREGCTTFMVLLAAFKLTISRSGAGEDITIGIPIAMREAAGVEHLIGYFNNHLAIRTDLSGGPTFEELLGRVRAAVVSAFAHQTFPLDELPIEGLLTKLYQVRFNYMTENENTTLTLPALRVEQLALPSEDESLFQLAVYVRDMDERLAIGFRYQTALFERATIESLMSSFVEMLKGAA